MYSLFLQELLENEEKINKSESRSNRGLDFSISNLCVDFMRAVLGS